MTRRSRETDMKLNERWPRDLCKCGRDKIAIRPTCRHCKKKEWNKNNSDKVREYARKWARSHPNMIKKNRDNYIKKHGTYHVKEKIKAWQKANRKKLNINRRKYYRLVEKRRNGLKAVKQMVAGWKK